MGFLGPGSLKRSWEKKTIDKTTNEDEKVQKFGIKHLNFAFFVFNYPLSWNLGKRIIHRYFSRTQVFEILVSRFQKATFHEMRFVLN